ncbi:TraR/DksA family transcriptional regulator [Sulfitobacter sp. JBTF-M27]|uniref:TraR/DksA family transcriptional regulator n=1 Tax=Sulfitobacter sediminilitoris TaxID=2698830 RepID=A0A6P0CE44_9RHOB|nr:TraR/DksA family transcriptional regulator [Sulfitobacter sediminilitoris]NEK23620.1 TraR/DksA family transcriptional regulator [Sulfitobacter sediminilitoris]
MVDHAHFKKIIMDRMSELGLRIHDIDEELGHQMTKDLPDQAIDLEDDEVLEGLGHAAEKEVTLLKAALDRIADGTYGTCLQCGEAISQERLEAVPYAPLCKNCATAATG